MLRAIGLISRSWQSWDPHSITVIIAEPKGDPPIPEFVSVIATVEVDLEDEIIPRAVGAAGAPIMKSSAFTAASAAVILLLGLVHLLYTFRGPMLHPRDPDLTARMMAVSPLITRETTMWRVWVGINATHSFGLILFGALYGYLAIRHSASLFHSCLSLLVLACTWLRTSTRLCSHRQTLLFHRAVSRSHASGGSLPFWNRRQLSTVEVQITGATRFSTET